MSENMMSIKIKNAMAYAILFAIAQIIFVLYICGVHFYPDSRGYISFANFILTGITDGNFDFVCVLRPLPPILAILLSPFVGSVTNGFIAENCIFLVVSSVLVFLITKEIYNNEKIALFSSFLFASSWVVLIYGLTVLTDMGVYFFIILGIYLTLLFFKKDGDYKFLLVIGLICGLGFLMKENAVISALFFFLMLLLSKNDVKMKIKGFLVFSLAFSIPIFINSVILYYLFNYSYFKMYSGTLSAYSAVWSLVSTILFIIVGVGFVFNIAFPFFIIGLYNQIKNRENLKIYISLIVSSIIPLFLFPTQDFRFVFIVFIGMIPLASYGIKVFCDYFDKTTSKINIKILGIGIVSTYVFVNMLIRFILSYYGTEIFVEFIRRFLPYAFGNISG